MSYTSDTIHWDSDEMGVLKHSLMYPQTRNECWRLHVFSKACIDIFSPSLKLAKPTRPKFHVCIILQSASYGHPANMHVLYMHPTLPRGKHPGPHGARKLTPWDRIIKKMKHYCTARYLWNAALISGNRCFTVVLPESSRGNHSRHDAQTLNANATAKSIQFNKKKTQHTTYVN